MFTVRKPPNWARTLQTLDSRVVVLGTVRQPPLATMLAMDADARLRAANRADRQAWDKVQSRADWEQFRNERVERLRASLGSFPPAPVDLKIQITRSTNGDGFTIDNLIYEGRPGLPITANLYRPTKPAASMPAIILCLSHQSLKNTSWRQDMAMTWARAGCVVLIPDHLGHGERRQHPFGDEPPHDYHFRFDLGIQLHLVGESLIGWMAWDLMRGVDLLLTRPEVDSKRLLMISEPAGGGDVAAVTAALDPRISCAMIQNFGGPEPETPYPLPRDADDSFAYAGSGSWESTRNLRLSARDGFLPWTIVASIAPRRLIYFHEFYWDEKHDPVWKRLQRVYGYYDSPQALVGLAGRGFVVGSAPENSHWLPVNRELLYPTLERWLGIPSPGREYSQPMPAEQLLCLTPAAKQVRKPLPLPLVLQQLTSERLNAARQSRKQLTPAENRERLRHDWARLLGDVAPRDAPSLQEPVANAQPVGSAMLERIHLCTEPGIITPLLLLQPSGKQHAKLPVVVGVAQQGKEGFLKHGSGAIAELLTAGFAVCLPDLRGTGETSPGEARDRRSEATTISSSELMLGQPLLGGRLRDLRSILRYLRSRKELDSGRIALWGDSFAVVNPANADFHLPYTAASRPRQSEPLGGMLALLTALYEEEIRAVYVRGGLSGFQAVLEDSFCYLPHDLVVPCVLSAGDLPDLAAALAPRPLWLEGLVDGGNRQITPDEAARIYEPARIAYEKASGAERLRMRAERGDQQSLAAWFTANMP